VKDLWTLLWLIYFMSLATFHVLYYDFFTKKDITGMHLTHMEIVIGGKVKGGEITISTWMCAIPFSRDNFWAVSRKGGVK
jgi:hypothetical protein